MSTLTPNFSLIKPGVNDPTDQDLWGGYLNDDLDTIDTVMKANQELAEGATSTKVANYTVLPADRNTTILVDATSGNITITLLPAATAGDGFEVTITKIDASTNTVTIDGNASETINGALTQSLTDQYQTISIVCNGSNWFSKTSAIAKATKANMEAQAVNKFPDAAIMKFHPALPKAWGSFDANGGSVSGFDAEYGCASVVRNSIGNYTITVDSAFASTAFVVVPSSFRSAGSGDVITIPTPLSTTTFRIQTTTVSSTPTDAKVHFAVFGTLA